MIKLLIVDDHRLIINGIKTMLEEVDDISIVAEASNGVEAVEAVRLHEDIDVALMDVKMPQKDGVEATREIIAMRPNLKVMALTMFEEDKYISNMLQAGAIGYVLKHTSKPELVAAIRKVSEGEPYFSHDIARMVMTRYLTNRMPVGPIPAGSGSGSEGSSELTDRETEILKLIASQLTNQEIAEKLFISPRTVHSHRRNLMQKIGVKNTAGLVRYAIENSII